MLDVHRLRLLRELDRRGTLAAVARALSYSPSAVSQQLSQLEAETGVVLLETAGRGVRLTAQARILVAHTEAVLERLEEAEAELRASLTEVRGTLRVASFQSVLLALVPEVLTRLAERHPGLRVEITHQEAGPAFAGLIAHEFDVVLGEEYPGSARSPVPGTRTQLLARDELFLVLPAHGPYARAEAATAPVHLPDLADVPWILDPASTAPGQWARDTCRAAGFEPDVRYAVPTISTPLGKHKLIVGGQHLESLKPLDYLRHQRNIQFFTCLGARGRQMPDRTESEVVLKIKLRPAGAEQFAFPNAQREQQFNGEQVTAAETIRFSDAFEQLDQFLVRQRPASGLLRAAGIQSRRELGDRIDRYDAPAHPEREDAAREAQQIICSGRCAMLHVIQ